MSHHLVPILLIFLKVVRLKPDQPDWWLRSCYLQTSSCCLWPAVTLAFTIYALALIIIIIIIIIVPG